MVHHGLLQVHWGQLFQLQYSWILGPFTDSISSFCPIYFTRVCAQSYTINTFTIFQPYHALPFIYYTSISLIISIYMHFLQYPLYSVYGIISYNSFHTCFHILSIKGVNDLCVFTYLFPFFSFSSLSNTVSVFI